MDNKDIILIGIEISKLKDKLYEKYCSESEFDKGYRTGIFHFCNDLSNIFDGVNNSFQLEKMVDAAIRQADVRQSCKKII